MDSRRKGNVTDNPPIFVFGSNLAGRHGKGAALWARRHRGAIYGQGRGRQGNSYAIPTKGKNMRTLPRDWIRHYVSEFIQYAQSHPDLVFEVTPIGTGLAGYTHADIAPMFKRAPENCLLPKQWTRELMWGIKKSAVEIENTVQQEPKSRPSR